MAIPSLPPHATVRDITSRPSGWVHPEAPGFVDPSDATKHPEMIRQLFWEDLNSLAPLIILDPN